MTEVVIKFTGKPGAGKTLLQRTVAAYLRQLGLGLTIDHDRHSIDVVLETSDKNGLGRLLDSRATPVESPLDRETFRRLMEEFLTAASNRTITRDLYHNFQAMFGYEPGEHG